MKRFFIDILLVAGKNKESAIVNFERGANIIIGSSDTGKSYIFQCINYLLGSEKLPKEDIPEAQGYTYAYLQIRTSTDKTYTICRSLTDKSIIYYAESTIENFRNATKQHLGIRNNTNAGDNLSEFLLKLLGVENVELKTNANNKTKKISFRDFARLAFIDETRILTEGSPVYTSNDAYTLQTKDKSALRFILTGQTDNNLIEVESKDIRESRIKGKIELINNLIQAKNDVIEKFQQNLDIEWHSDTQKGIRELITRVNNSTNTIEQLSKEKESYFRELEKAKSELLYNKELLERFELLKMHYQNDIERLKFISEGKSIFDQFYSNGCPLCGNNINNENLSFRNSSNEQLINEAIGIEYRKIEIKVIDLKETIQELSETNNNLSKKIDYYNQNINNIDNKLSMELIPLKKHLEEELSKFIILNNIQNAKEEIISLNQKNNELNNELKMKKTPEIAKIDIASTALNDLCKIIELILKNWHYPNLTSVLFNTDHKVYDMKISNRARNSHGKGIRSITYSAFTLGLLEYCMQKEQVHPGVVIIDSPLTTYHNNEQPQESDEVDSNMQSAFYNYIATTDKDRQVIILDNKIPSNDVIARVNYISFDKSKDSLRKGFFPY